MSQIEKLQNNLARCRYAVLQKGGTVGSAVAFDNLPQEILTIPSEGNQYILEDNSATAFRKNIPSGVESYIKLKSIGGMTYKRIRLDNLISPPKTVSETFTGAAYLYHYLNAVLLDSTTDAVELKPNVEYAIRLNIKADAPITNGFIAVIFINGEMFFGQNTAADEYRFTVPDTIYAGNLTCEYEFNAAAESITVTYSPVLAEVTDNYELVDSKVTAIRSYSADGILKANYLIPEALQGTGKGIEGYSDTTDFERGKFIQKTETLVIGPEKIGQVTNYDFNGMRGVQFGERLLQVLNRANGICTDSDLAGNYLTANSIWIGVNNKILYWIGILDILGFATIDEFKTYVLDRYYNGNPVTLTYALAEPIETDLTETISTYLKVEEGGYIEFVNDDSKAVPSSISYLRRI